MITSEKWCLTVSSNFTHVQAVGCLGWHPRHPSACTCVKIYRGLLFSFKNLLFIIQILLNRTGKRDWTI